MEPLRLAFTVGCLPERAFALWAEHTSRWWPHGHSASGEPGVTVVFEPDGRIYERTPDGVEHDWGEVLVWEPPHRLVYLWHLRFDRSDATEVEVRFEPAGEGTAVTIEHRGWERLGAVADEAGPVAPLRVDHACLVLEGVLGVRIGDEVMRITPGEAVCVPAGTSKACEERVRCLVAFSSQA